MACNLGLDIGGTKIEGIVIRGSEVLHTLRVPTNAAGGYAHILGRVRDVYEALVAHIGNEPHTLGVGTPGSMSEKLPYMKNSNIGCFNGKELRGDFERTLGRAVVMDNDANCFALAESLMGSGAGHEMVFGAVLGTGCGGGVVYNGQCYRGTASLAGEWGHLSMNPDGPACYCGRRGCVETYISGGGLQRLWEAQYGEALSLKEIVRSCERGDGDAVSFMELFYGNFAEAMANLIAVLDPDIIVLGGGVVNIEGIYEFGIARVAGILNREGAQAKIVKGSVGSSAGSIGAALLAAER